MAEQAIGFDFLAIWKEARHRFINDATTPLDINEHLARVAFEHGTRATLTKGDTDNDDR